MRRIRFWLAAACLLAWPSATLAEREHCPYDVKTCLEKFDEMRHRP